MKKIILISFLTIFSLQCIPRTADSAFEDVTITNPVEDVEAGIVLSNIFEKLKNIVATIAILAIAISGGMYLSAGANPTQAENAKKTLTGAIIGLILFLGAPSFLKQINIILTGNTTGVSSYTNAKTISKIVENTLSFILSIGGILAIIGLVISGLMYLTSGGNPSQADKAKNGIKYTIIGVIVMSSALIIVKQIARFF